MCSYRSCDFLRLLRNGVLVGHFVTKVNNDMTKKLNLLLFLKQFALNMTII